MNAKALIAAGRRLALAAALLGVTGCATGADPAPTASATSGPTASAAPSTAPAAPATPITPPAPTQEPPVPTDIALNITVNGTVVGAVLQNNAASASLLAQLPLDLSFTDYNDQEKIARLPAPLALDGLPLGGSAEPGTFGYYAPDQAIVLYYDSVGYYEGIIPLGTFDNVAAVRDAPAFVGTVSPGAE